MRRNRHLQEKMSFSDLIGVACFVLFIGFVGSSEIYPGRFWIYIVLALVSGAIGFTVIKFFSKGD